MSEDLSEKDVLGSCVRKMSHENMKKLKQQSNTTSTMLIRSTLAAPNENELAFSVSCVIHCQMWQDNSVKKHKKKDILTKFDEKHYAAHPELLSDEIPEQDSVFQFILKVFEIAKFSAECHVISLVYINRILAFTEMALHNRNWRLIMLCALLLAQKVWDDRSVANVDFPVIWKNVVPAEQQVKLTLSDVNSLERQFLELIMYNVTVPSSLYARYFFELRDLCEENEMKFPLSPLPADAVIFFSVQFLSFFSGTQT
eukprot:TRINITY_DN1570_c0_g1_i3.p1 TRINITY_DN1570_c0_g1~~TRINITY_DN1570_c0_g1_i3.p1  ORF type:complete len:256 (+),score=43.18 TRINITY_DN1570_c0_g1_i3:85-852(+)